jgi:lipoprotein-releasing system ATP-binding protein
MSEILEAKNLLKKYGNLQVLKGIDLSVLRSEIISIVGASGAGKSTLLHILGTLDTPDEGELIIEGEKVSSMNSNHLARFRNQRLGFVFQFHNLLPEFTALENVCIPAFIASKEEKTTQERAMMLLEMLNVAHRKHHRPSEMSGGEQQRVAVARSLINSPSIIFADEPSGNLDTKNATELHELFFRLRKELGQTFVIVTHNEHFANMADRRLEIKDGKIVK